MTIASTQTSVQYTSTGTSRQYPFNNKVFAATDIVVTLIDPVSGLNYPFVNFANAVLGLNYSVQNVDSDAGCFVFFNAVQPTGYIIDIRTQTPETQATSIKNQGSFLPELHEEALDKLTREVQDLTRLTYTFGIHGPDTEAVAWSSLPAAAARKGLALMFDAATGLPTVGIPNTQTLTPGLIGGLLWPQQAVETAAGVAAFVLSFMPLDPRRYATAANWSAVYAAVSAPTDTDWPYYRGDHSQHNTQTNLVVGFKTFDDSQLTGTIGWHCTALGALALQFNGQSVSAGGTNTAIGFASQQHMIDGSGNTACGPETMNVLTGLASSHNNSFGYRGLASCTLGTQNNTFGFIVLTNLLTGNNNHCFGESVLQALTLGNANHLYGYQAGFNTLVADYMHGVGYQVFTSQSQGFITAITKAVSAVITINTVSAANPFTPGCPIGIEGATGMTQINGVLGNVTAIGGASGAWTITTDIDSSGFSVYTGSGAVFPVGNTGMGYQAGAALNCAGANTLIGWQTGQVNPIDIGNTMVGNQAGRRLSTGGTRNTAIGWFALTNCLGGINNTCAGFQAGSPITTGGQNVCIGDSSGAGITTASQNVAIGSATMVNLNGASNVAVGFNAGSQGSAQTFTNTASLGNSATPTASNQVTLGNASIATLRCQVTTITALSDARDKSNILDMDLGIDYIEMVQFRKFKRAHRDGSKDTDTYEAGIIAQELGSIAQRYQDQFGVDTAWMGLVDETDPDRLEATPGKLLYPMGVAIQQLSARLKALENRLH